MHKSYTITRTPKRVILRHQGRVIGIYSDPIEAQRGADLDRRQRMPKLKVTLIVESPLDHEATPEELKDMEDAMDSESGQDLMYGILEKEFDITIENHKGGA
jgi:hypothetical protein